MRLHKREVKGFNNVLDVLGRCQTGHLGLVDDQGPYVVPISFGFEVVDGRVVIWCHGAIAGRKISAIRAGGRVCFEADWLDQIVKDVPEACDMTALYESVIGFGWPQVVADPAEARRGAAIIVDRYRPGASLSLPDPLRPNVAVFRIVLDEITGKRRRLTDN
ncbi:MAG: pyridoxamine 5'-phosphate oxidase family protein [Propionibacteriaceae bacterium]|nr:pyridoxamine 5'-phosphate oxidase family protein [Propionibacteriaceae bacterium]